MRTATPQLVQLPDVRKESVFQASIAEMNVYRKYLLATLYVHLLCAGHICYARVETGRYELVASLVLIFVDNEVVPGIDVIEFKKALLMANAPFESVRASKTRVPLRRVIWVYWSGRGARSSVTDTKGCWPTYSTP